MFSFLIIDECIKQLYCTDILRTEAQQSCSSWPKQWLFCVVHRSGVTFFG